MNPEKVIENHWEILLRFTPLQKGGWFYFIVFTIVLAIAASWELLEWWGGRDLTAMLPKLFLNHFNDTSFVAENNDRMIGFLIGFLSPSLKLKNA